MRRMSFFLTPRQLLAGTKTVTRRFSWDSLMPGDEVLAVHKCQGLKKGEKQRVLAKLRVTSSYALRLNDGSDDREAALEGFPHMTWSEFVAFFCKANKCDPDATVNRIAFEVIEQYVTLEAWDAEHRRAA